jgi:hypothetical protein
MGQPYNADDNGLPALAAIAILTLLVVGSIAGYLLLSAR